MCGSELGLLALFRAILMLLAYEFIITWLVVSARHGNEAILLRELTVVPLEVGPII